MKTTYVIGVDPGLKGGIAFLSEEKLVVHPTPVIVKSFMKNGKKKTRSEMDLDKVYQIIGEYDGPSMLIDCAYLEHVSAMPGQGVTGMFRFGQNFGQWQGVLAGFGIRTVLVRPQTWKAAFGLNRSKTTSLELAREFWPDNSDESFRLKKHDGLAEASLIAKYGYQAERESSL